MIRIQKILLIAIYGRVGSNSNMRNTSFAGSDWLVPLLLYQTSALFLMHSVLMVKKNEQSKQN